MFSGNLAASILNFKGNCNRSNGLPGENEFFASSTNFKVLLDNKNGWFSLIYKMVKLVVLSQVEIPDSLSNIIWIIIFKWEDQFELKKIPLG